MRYDRGRFLNRLLIASGLALGWGCRPSPESVTPVIVRIETTKAAYSIGDTVILVRRNVSTVTVWFRECKGPELQRFVANQWVATPATSPIPRIVQRITSPPNPEASFPDEQVL